MKKTKALFILIFLLASTVACNQTNSVSSIETKVPLGATSDVNSQSENVSPESNSDFSDMILAKKEMLEDYDAIWISFENNSPFLNLIERKHGANYLEDTIAKYRKQIEELETSDDEAMFEFTNIISQAVYEATLDVDRHSGFENSDYFFENQATYRELIAEIPELKPWLDLLENPETIKFYEYFDYLIENVYDETENNSSDEKKLEEDDNESAERGETVLEQENLTMEVIEEGKTAYIKIDSFATELMNKDMPNIRDFIVGVKDYENLIIDISSNGGGNTEYWEKAFVEPNISELMTVSTVKMMRDGDLASKFYADIYSDSTLTVADVKNNPAFTALQEDDISQMFYATEQSFTLEPLNNEKLFQGKIWVLTSPRVYSSAEAFAVFCKSTKFATLVGETTGGGNTGGPVWLELPNSHMLISFDVEYPLNQDGSCSQEMGTIPDIESDNPLATVLELIAEK